MDLMDFGWKEPSFPAPPDGAHWAPARVIEQQKGVYRVMSTSGERWAEVIGRLLFDAPSRMSLPVVGDWVWIQSADPDGETLIHGVWPRRNCLSRLSVGRDKTLGEEEPLAANVDVMLIVTSLNKEFKASRLERYGTLAWKNDIRPVVLLNKADLCDDVGSFVAETEEALPGVAVRTISAKTGEGLDQLGDLLAPRSTAILLGSSGVGKSTIVNRLMDRAVRETSDIRSDDDRGRHTTTTRSLLRLPSGALLIDSPGLREVSFAPTAEGIDRAFTDIGALAAQCRFSDCRHQQEPACAVQEALRTGALPERRFLSYQKLLQEQAHLERKTDKAAALKQKGREKDLSRRIKDVYKHRDKRSPR
jgi:ribosome biogenesis GTPase